MESKKTYIRERPESWKYFHAPYNIVVYGLSIVLSLVGTIGWLGGHMVSIALVAISMSALVLYAEAHLKRRRQFCEQFFKEENISPKDYNVWQKLQGKQVIFIVEPKKKSKK